MAKRSCSVARLTCYVAALTGNFPLRDATQCTGSHTCIDDANAAHEACLACIQLVPGTHQPVPTKQQPTS